MNQYLFLKTESLNEVINLFNIELFVSCHLLCFIFMWIRIFSLTLLSVIYIETGGKGACYYQELETGEMETLTGGLYVSDQFIYYHLLQSLFLLLIILCVTCYI